MSTRLRSLPLRNSDVLLVDEADRSLLVAPGDDASHVLNPTARAIWELCDGRTDPDEMVGAICQVFSVTMDIARADVAYALDQLTAAGLVRWTDGVGEAGNER